MRETGSILMEDGVSKPCWGQIHVWAKHSHPAEQQNTFDGCVVVYCSTNKKALVNYKLQQLGEVSLMAQRTWSRAVKRAVAV